MTSQDEPVRPKPKMRRPRSAAQSARDIAQAEKRRDALEFRRQGYTYKQIAEEMGIHTSTAFGYVADSIRAITEEEAHGIRKLELDRLDYLQQALFTSFTAAPEKETIDGILRIMDRRARYLGLYKTEDDTAMAIQQMGVSLAAMVAADKPILRPDGPIPANPVM